MEKDFKNVTIHINRFYWDNFALGFDFYSLYDYDTGRYNASVFQLSFLLFNVTLTFWKREW